MTKKNLNKIGIDCRLSGDAHAGIGRYIEELITRLPGLNKKIDWVLFFYSKKQADEYSSNLGGSKPNIKIVICPIKHYSLAEQFRMPRIFRKEKLDLLHVPHFNIPIFYNGKIIVTIHDLLWHEFRGLNVTTLNPFKYLVKYFSYKFITAKALKKAKKIIVPANTIKKTILKYYPKVENKIMVIKEGAGEKFKTKKAKTSNKYDLSFIYVGSLYPHKNIKVVLQALKDLPEFKLKLVGSRNIFGEQTKKMIKKFGVENQVKFLGFLSDEDLNKQLQNSFALVQPSLSEGFGLTGIEAMAAGVPVLASNIPIFNEIYKRAPIYFDPKDSESFIKAVEKLKKENRNKIISTGIKLSKFYNWDVMSKKTLEAYES